MEFKEEDSRKKVDGLLLRVQELEAELMLALDKENNLKKKVYEVIDQ